MRTSPRRRIRIDWAGAILTTVVGLIMAVPISGLVTLLLGASHAADPRVPALGFEAAYPLVIALWSIGSLVRTDIQAPGPIAGGGRPDRPVPAHLFGSEPLLVRLGGRQGRPRSDP